MKNKYTKIVLLVLLSLLFSHSFVFAQVPQAINFQAIARDGSGNPMVNTNIQIRLSVIDSAQAGTIVYQELRALQTNAYGSFSFQIGVNPSFTTIGSFPAINWVTGNKHLKIDYDPTNTFTFNLTLGVIKFVTVPYAFTAETVAFIDATGAQDGDILIFNSSSGKFEAEPNIAASVEWNDVQNKPINVSDFSNDVGYISQESQVLSTSNDTIFLTGGSFVKLPLFSTNSLPLPTLTTLPATNIQITSATLNGSVNANGLTTTVQFEWGLTTSYGNTVDVSQSPITGNLNTLISVGLNNIHGDTTFHYRIKATNAVDVTYSNDMTFSTLTGIVPTVTILSLSTFMGTSARINASITNQGSCNIISYGLCFSTSPNPTIANIYIGYFPSTITNLTPNTTYYVRAYATSLAGIGYSNEVSFNSGKIIGSTFGGGLVFYNDGTGHGLVCAEFDQSLGAEWGCSDTTIGTTSTALNTGAANTTAIITGCSTPGIAAYICDTLTLEGFSDWYLPSKDEFYLISYLHTLGLGGFSTYYWTSSEFDATTAWRASPTTTNYESIFGNRSKGATYMCVRAVRSF